MSILPIRLRVFTLIAHGGVNCLRKTSTDNASKEEHDSPELGPFGSTEALDVLKKATKLVEHFS